MERFLQESYIGCYQCLLCLHCNKELAKFTKRLGNHLSNVLSVFAHVLSEYGASTPDLSSEKQHYDKCKLEHLSELTKRYLEDKKDKKDKTELLRRNVQLITNFEIVSEMDFALNHLQVEFEELKRNPHEVSPHLNDFMLFSEMEKTTDFSWSC